MSVLQTCKFCGKPFEAQNRRFEVCSDTCRKKHDCEYTHKRYHSDIERSRMNVRESHQRNRIKELAYQEKYRQSHKDYFSKKSKEWYWKNRDEVRKSVKEWVSNNRERKSWLCNKRRESEISLGLLPNFEIVQMRKNLFNGYCFCDKQSRLTIEHLVPICKGGTNETTNLFGSCGRCNASKNKSDWKEWFRKQRFYTPEREICIENYSRQGIKMEASHPKERHWIKT